MYILVLAAEQRNDSCFVLIILPIVGVPLITAMLLHSAVCSCQFSREQAVTQQHI